MPYSIPQPTMKQKLPIEYTNFIHILKMQHIREILHIEIGTTYITITTSSRSNYFLNMSITEDVRYNELKYVLDEIKKLKISINEITTPLGAPFDKYKDQAEALISSRQNTRTY